MIVLIVVEMGVTLNLGRAQEVGLIDPNCVPILPIYGFDFDQLIKPLKSRFNSFTLLKSSLGL